MNHPRKSGYRPTREFERTPEQYRDPLLAWERDDMAFFAAGACHILAYAFMEQQRSGEFYIIHIRPKGYSRGHHVFATNGDWAFDHFGWTKEAELLEVTRQAYADTCPGWDFDRVVIEDDIETFCINNRHMLPSDFPFSPWERAFNYLQKFELTPPNG